MKQIKHQITYLKDYTAPDFYIDKVFLDFDLHEDFTRVKSKLSVRRNPEKSNQDLELSGEELILEHIMIDDKELSSDRYMILDNTLTIKSVPEKFDLETTVLIKPHLNTRLSGLYKSGGNFCTQCESQGFRRITYYLDRPDNLARFTTRITADKKRYPILLSNGNLIEKTNVDQERHRVKWEDPTLKPSYLFALVAGNFDAIEDEFITQSGRSVALSVYVEKGKRDQAVFAMESLKRAMKWDEETFGREYDLNNYMIVAVNDFNFGAMENKGLNIFNDKYILAKPETATDNDYVNIQSVVGHEYFHNWSGNRVTVKNWFQITLKEGLTVFREQSFSEDMLSKGVQRIKDVEVIRNVQFPQDAGPIAHPIMLDSYLEVNNFYTVTVYDKGSEVIRMLQTILGKEVFRKAMDVYFSDNDGHAVTTEEFVQAMEKASKLDLTQFRQWYHQAGTPILTVTDHYDAAKKTYQLTIKQQTPPTPGQSQKVPLHIPMSVALFDAQTKKALPLHLKGGSKTLESSGVLNLKKSEETFEFTEVPSKPIPSLLRNFSAPVKLKYPYTQEQLKFLMSYDSDEFNRWDAAQQLSVKELLRVIHELQAGKKAELQDIFSSFLPLLENVNNNEALLAEMLTLPSESYLSDLVEMVDVDVIHQVRDDLKKQVAKTLKQFFLDYYQQEKTMKAYEFSAQALGKRRLKNLALAYLALLEEEKIYDLCLEQFHQANNMTDMLSAMSALMDVDCTQRNSMLEDFYQRWQHETLAVDKWLMLQAHSSLPDTFDRVKELLKHPSFDHKNPNKVHALIGAFTRGNPIRFHDRSGQAYAFLIEQVKKIDTINPQVASRLLEPLTHWRKFDPTRQALMKQELEGLLKTQKLSNDVYEIVSKSLAV